MSLLPGFCGCTAGNISYLMLNIYEEDGFAEITGENPHYVHLSNYTFNNYRHFSMYVHSY